MAYPFSKLRRLVLQRSTLGLAAVAAAAYPWTHSQATEQLPKLSEGDPTAKQLKYVHNAATVPADVRSNTSDYCYNCRYFKGDQSTAWAKCDLFPGKLVNSKGWCSVWAKKN